MSQWSTPIGDARLNRALRNADLERQHARQLAEAAQNAPTGTPSGRRQRTRRDPKAMTGIPVVSATNDAIPRAIAGIGPTDPWKRQRERDYATRSGANSTCTLSVGQILRKSQNECYLCRTPLEPTTMQADHIIPLALGGTHTDENVAAACRRCNSRKGKRIVSFAIATRRPVYSEAR